MVTETQFQELEDKVQELSTSIGDVSEKISSNVDRITEKDNFQLKDPIDPYTSKIIKDQIVIPVTHVLTGTEPATSGNYNHFFTANTSYVVDGVSVVFSAAGSDAGAVTLDIYKAASTVAIGSGASILTSTVNLKGTANTIYSPTLAVGDKITLKINDRLGLILTGTPTAVANLSVTVNLKQL